MGSESLDRQWGVRNAGFATIEKDRADRSFVNLNSFQMVSLLKLATVTEEGVRFLSPHDGSPMYDALHFVTDTLLKERIGIAND